MTALAGCWTYDGRPHPDESCKRMLAAQAMYGPHGERQWSNGPLAMGRRLFRTVPEDIHDRQPLQGADGRLILVADVRLDNREELTAALGLSSERILNMCDAAMLLVCLERWGEQALDRIVGDFAFVLWDQTEHKLLLARDFLGSARCTSIAAQAFSPSRRCPRGSTPCPRYPTQQTSRRWPNS
jgi:asparagine synthase (glutamine-hydrolysing)